MLRTEQEIRHIRKPKKGESAVLPLVERGSDARMLISGFMSAAQNVPEFAYQDSTVTELFSYKYGLETKHGKIDLLPYRWEITSVGGITTGSEEHSQLVVNRNTIGKPIVPRRSGGVQGWDENLTIEYSTKYTDVQHASVCIEAEWLDERYYSLGKDDVYALRIGKYMLEDFQNGVSDLYSQQMSDDELRLQAENIAARIKAYIPDHIYGYNTTQTDRTVMHEKSYETYAQGKELLFSEKIHESGNRYYCAEIEDDAEEILVDFDEEPNIRRDVIEIFIPSLDASDRDNLKTQVSVDSLDGNNYVFSADESSSLVVLRAVENRMHYIHEVFSSRYNRTAIPT